MLFVALHFVIITFLQQQQLVIMNNQQQLNSWIQKYTKQKGTAPTQSQIAQKKQSINLGINTFGSNPVGKVSVLDGMKPEYDSATLDLRGQTPQIKKKMQAWIASFFKGRGSFPTLQQQRSKLTQFRNGLDTFNNASSTNVVQQSNQNQQERLQKLHQNQINRLNKARTDQENKRAAELADLNRKLAQMQAKKQQQFEEAIRQQQLRINNQKLQFQRKLLQTKQKQQEKMYMKAPKQQTSRQYQDMIQAKAILDNLKLRGTDSLSSLDVQFKKVIRKQYFSADAIQKQLKQISKRIFYYPSVQMCDFIQLQLGKDVQSVIYKCAAFKHADLILLKNRMNAQLRYQMETIMKNLIPWGVFFIDINSLQIRATNTIGSSSDTKYNLTQYDLVVRVSTQGITIKFKQKNVTPFQMKNYILKQMAYQSLQKKATKTYFQFLRQNNPMY